MANRRGIPEGLWRKAEANQVARERRRLIKLGRIKMLSRPNILVKDDETGKWRLPAL